MDRFRLRMLEKVIIEALLVAAGQNTKRLVASHGRGLSLWRKWRSYPSLNRYHCALEGVSESAAGVYFDAGGGVFQHAGAFLVHIKKADAPALGDAGFPVLSSLGNGNLPGNLSKGC